MGSSETMGPKATMDFTYDDIRVYTGLGIETFYLLVILLEHTLG